MNPKFPTGTVVTTPAAQEAFELPFMARCLERHVQGDWGDVSADDKAANDRDLLDEGRLLSVYKQGGKTLYIITEADRSVTTFLLPSDY